MAQVNRQWHLAARPVGLVKERISSGAKNPSPSSEGQFVVHNLYSLTRPTYRGWMNEAGSYVSLCPLVQ